MNRDEVRGARGVREVRPRTTCGLSLAILFVLVSACDSSPDEPTSSPSSESRSDDHQPPATGCRPSPGPNGSAPGLARSESGPGAVVVVRAPADERPVRFEPWAIELEVGDVPVAAYQVELVVRSGDATIVGVEGGTTDGFREPPYYDPKALAGGRIVLAAFNTRVALSRGRHRVATVHMREAGPAPTYELRLTAVGAPDGSPVVADIDLVSGKGEEG